MADRYWVGGSGTWDATTTTNWSETSGGTGGASAPTSLDDVYFDGNSDSGANFTVTVGTGAVCRTFDANTELPLEYTMTFAGSAALGIYGSLDLPATRFTRTYTGQINFLSSTTGNTINTNGVVLPPLNFDNVSGGWILEGSIIAGNFTFNAGILDTSGYNITLGTTSSFNSISNFFRQIYFRNSTVTTGVYSAFNIYGNNLTIDSGTSKIITYYVFRCNNGTTWYDLVLSSNNGGANLTAQNCVFNDFILTNSGDTRGSEITIGGNNAFNNLIIRDNTLNHRHIKLLGNLTINGTLIVESSNLGRRWAIESDIPGTKRTITANNVSLIDVDFRDITAAGSSIPWSGTRIGDAGGNTNITFTPPKTVYWNKLDGGAWNSLAWALAPSGTPSLENVPLPQDTAIISDTGLDSGATISVYSWNLPNFDASSRTLPFNLSISSLANFSTGHRVNPFFCGDIKIPSVCTITDTGLLITNASNNQSIQCNTTIPNGIVVNKSDGTLTLQSNISTSGTFTLTRGTLNLNALVLTSTLEFNTSSSQSRTINFNNGSINCGANWNATTSTNLLLTGPGSILMSGASAKSFIGGTKIYDGINLVQNGLGTLTITGTNTFGSISNNVLTSSGSTIIFPNVTTTLQNKPSLNGLTGSQLVLSRTGTSGTFTLSYSGSGLIQLDNVSVSNSVVQPTSTWNAFRSIDGGGNAGWISFNSLNAGLNLYWVGGTGTWDSVANTNWALVSGGSGGVSAPTSANNVFFDGNSDSGSAFTVTIGTGAANKNVTVSGLDQTMTLAGTGTWSVHGDLEFAIGAPLVNSHQGSMNFNGTDGVTNYIRSNGVTLAPGGGVSNSPFNIRLNINSGKWVLGSALAITPQSYNGGFYVNGGIFDTAGYNLTAAAFVITSASTKEVYFRNSTISLSSNFDNTSTAGSLTFDAGTSTLVFGQFGVITSPNQSLVFYDAILGQQLWSYIGSGNQTFNKITSGAVTYSPPLVLQGNVTVNELEIPSYKTIISDVLGTQRTLTINSALTTGSNPILFRDINVTGPLAPISGTNFGDAGNNSGIIFREPKTLYARSTSLFSYTSFTWSDTSTGIANSYILPQDTGIIDDNSPNSISWPYSAAYIIGTLNATGRTTPLTLSINSSGSVQTLIYATFNGDLKLSSAVTLTTPNGTGISQILSFQGHKNQTLKLSGQQINTIDIQKVNSSIALESDITIANTRILALTSGTLNTNNYNITCGSFSSSNSNQRTINLGTSKVTLTGTSTVWNTATATNLTLNAQNSTIALKNAGDQTFAGGGLTYGKLVVENP